MSPHRARFSCCDRNDQRQQQKHDRAHHLEWYGSRAAVDDLQAPDALLFPPVMEKMSREQPVTKKEEEELLPSVPKPLADTTLYCGEKGKEESFEAQKEDKQMQRNAAADDASDTARCAF